VYFRIPNLALIVARRRVPTGAAKVQNLVSCFTLFIRLRPVEYTDCSVNQQTICHAAAQQYIPMKRIFTHNTTFLHPSSFLPSLSFLSLPFPSFSYHLPAPLLSHSPFLLFLLVPPSLFSSPHPSLLCTFLPSLLPLPSFPFPPLPSPLYSRFPSLSFPFHHPFSPSRLLSFFFSGKGEKGWDGYDHLAGSAALLTVYRCSIICRRSSASGSYQVRGMMSLRLPTGALLLNPTGPVVLTCGFPGISPPVVNQSSDWPMASEAVDCHIKFSQ